MAASATAKAWNKGKTGAPSGRPLIPTSRSCLVEGCGGERGQVARKISWVLIEVIGSTEPPRLYCSWDCAARGSALAELRVGA